MYTLKNMTKVHVISGGTSSEREVSLRSGAAVAAALQSAGYDVTILDLASASLEEMADCDVVFPALHGIGGEDGTLQAKLDTKHVRYVGSGAAASALCFDKWRYRQTVTDHGLPMAEGALVTADSYQEHPLTAAPFVLKPFNGGSSIDTFIVRDPKDIPRDKIADAFTRYPELLLERLIIGTELTVGVLGDMPLTPIEIIPPEHAEFDYENKYNGATRELCPPEHVSQELQEEAKALALKAHQLTDCRDLTRTDIMLDQTGQLFLLETNTLPGMTDQSLFPKAARAAGIEMTSLCSQLVEMALKRQA